MTGNTPEILNSQQENLAYIMDCLSDSIEESKIEYDELSLTVSRQKIVDVLRFLRDNNTTKFLNFVDLCGVDYPNRRQRFEVVYHLLSPYYNARIRVKVKVGLDDSVPSIIDVFPAAEWFEREAYDLYGILFTNHPDLRRILTDYGFDGHPLRKDFPLTGFVEVCYDDEYKRVAYQPVDLAQEFRSFDFLSPWGGA